MGLVFKKCFKSKPYIACIVFPRYTLPPFGRTEFPASVFISRKVLYHLTVNRVFLRSPVCTLLDMSRRRHDPRLCPLYVCHHSPRFPTKPLFLFLIRMRRMSICNHYRLQVDTRAFLMQI